MALRNTLVTCGVLGLALAVTIAVVRKDAAPSAQAADIVNPEVPKAALLATHPGAELTSVFLVEPGGTSILAPVTTFGHLPDATVRAVVIPGKAEILATADVTPTRDASFNAALFYLRPHTPPMRLVDRVVHASRPLAMPSGRVFVSRGIAGNEVDGQMRVDALTIDEVNLATGATRMVHQMNGYLLFLAGSWNGEIIVYRISTDKADLVAIDADTGKDRFLLQNLPPFARDFSVDPTHHAIVFQNRDETDSGTWVVDRVDINSGQRQRLFSSASMTMAPYALPRGGVLFNPPGHGLTTLEGSLSLGGPLGAGVDVIADASADGHYLAAAHTEPSQFAVPFVVDTQRGAARVLPAPANARVVVAGFVADGGGK